MINLTIDDTAIEVEEGSTVLKAAEKAGIAIPTLCSHKALTPYGGCRLCLVDVSQDGNRWSVQASCTYPATDGLQVKTNTDRVLQTRKIMAELLLARCPDSEEVRDVAKSLGVEEPRIKPKDKDCTLCGVCVRMCAERMGPAVLTFTGRGQDREVVSPYGVPSDVCQACGACVFVCPTGRIQFGDVTTKTPRPIPDEYNMGMNSRAAAYIPYPQAVPNKATIDPEHCVHLQRGDCKVCSEVCEADAIDYEQKEETLDLNVGAIVLAPGYDLFDANLKKELGYDRYPNVVTSLEYERIQSASGPWLGKILRPSDEKHAHKVAFIQCVGSRDREHDYCSSICCMYATKEAIISKEHESEMECTIFHIDLRAFSKGFEEYYKRAQELGIRYIRCIPSMIKDIPNDGSLRVQYFDGKELKEEIFDMVVLSTGVVPTKGVRQLADAFDVKLDDRGFCETATFSPVETSREGVYVCGPFAEPKDIPETVVQASGAAAKAMELLGDVRGTQVKPKEYPPERDVSGEEPRIGVFVCWCGSNIGGVVRVEDVVEYAKTLPNVEYAESNLYTCSNDTQRKITETVLEKNLNRVVVASCTPRTHEPLFRDTVRQAGLNEYLFEMANIRDQCSWVHREQPDEATEKSKDLLRMAVAKSRLLEQLERPVLPIKHDALVIGGGLSGMTAALSLAAQGFKAHLVEREKELGGKLRNLRYLIGGEDPVKRLADIEARVRASDNVEVYTDSSIKEVSGFLGNFKSVIANGAGEKTVDHGVIVVATGAQEHKPKSYRYGEDDRVKTQMELEEKLSSGDFKAGAVVMIQCVEARCDERGYCSRICCSEAIKNALKIKELSPDTAVYVLYRDIRAYGFKEKYYSQARDAGVVFLRHEDEEKPELKEVGGGLVVSTRDPVLDDTVEIAADMVVLSVPTVPNEDNQALAQMLKVPLTEHGFFLEAHMKLRPIDFATEGIYLAGIAHGPKTVDESVGQSLAAAARAATVLSKDKMELEGAISEVIDKNCDGCAYCVEPCPYDALTLIEYMYKGQVKKTVQRNEASCKGCGCCQATCPKAGIVVRHFKPEQLSAMVNAALEGAMA